VPPCHCEKTNCKTTLFTEYQPAIGIFTRAFSHYGTMTPSSQCKASNWPSCFRHYSAHNQIAQMTERIRSSCSLSKKSISDGSDYVPTVSITLYLPIDLSIICTRMLHSGVYFCLQTLSKNARQHPMPNFLNTLLIDNQMEKIEVTKTGQNYMDLLGREVHEQNQLA